MNISLKKLNPEDFPDAPGWVGPILETLNENFEQLGQLNQRNLSFDDQHDTIRKRVKVKHAVDYEIDVTELRGDPDHVRFKLLDLIDKVDFDWSVLRPGVIRVNFDFATAPTNEREVELLIFGR